MLERLVHHPELFDQLREQARRVRTTPIAQLGTLQELEAAFKAPQTAKVAETGATYSVKRER